MKKETKPTHRKLDKDELDKVEDTPPGIPSSDADPKSEKSREVKWEV